MINPTAHVAWGKFVPILVEGVTTTTATIVAPSSRVTTAMSSEAASAMRSIVLGRVRLRLTFFLEIKSILKGKKL
jgi:hypothetical protein